MEIKDLQANTGNVELTVKVVSKDEPRTFEKFGKEGRVCNAKIKDDSGEVTLTLWNDDVDKVNVGDNILVKNGWCSEFRDEKQVSSGKFGTIEVLEKAEDDTSNTAPEAAQEETIEETVVQEGGVLTNDPTLLNPKPATQEPQSESPKPKEPQNGIEVEEAQVVDDNADIVIDEEMVE